MALLKKMWKNSSKHKKLCEDWSTAAGSQLLLSPIGTDVNAGVKFFQLKYLGAAPAERACSAPATAAAVKLAVAQAKSGGKKTRVGVTVSPKGIVVEDASTSERILDISIYKISYCSADAAHSNVFAFIAQGPGEALECYTFLCPKRKVARDVTLAAAHSFNMAYQVWQANQDLKRARLPDRNILSLKLKSEKHELDSPVLAPSSLLIDLYTGDEVTSPWVSFEEEGRSDLWTESMNTFMHRDQLVS